MPIFMDRHDLAEMSAADIAEAHRKDLECQAKYKVRFLTYWFDEQSGKGFCLIDAPDAETAMRVHDEAHGDVARDIIPVELSAVEAFLGRITDPAPHADGGAAPAGGAVRAVMFTDIVESTAMTARLGDARAIELVRAHDSLVRRALGGVGGREIKHTGDGIMAAFDEISAALDCACAIQRAFADFNGQSIDQLQVRIGLAAGEPVEDSRDLFGATVQLAARACQEAAPGSIAVAENVRAGAAERFALEPLGERRLKGFGTAVPLYRVVWD